MLIYKELAVDDYPFLEEIAQASPEWKREEKFEGNIEEYLLVYKMYHGKWYVWYDKSMPVGISYFLEWSPSNEKPWLGTVLIEPGLRGDGYGRQIIDNICNELSKENHKAIFAACPIERDDWLLFLAKCNFEQFKVEKSDTEKEYMILVRPL